jgi:3-deoxy-D-manno-octulosonic-acid transferase
MSDRSARRYRTLFKLVSNPIPVLSRLCLQTEADLARYVALGAAPDRCRVTGNCKFDAAARTPPVEKVEALRAVVLPLGPLLVAGSTHLGEEDVVLEALAAARKVSPGTRLLWAPRYLEHADSLISRARNAGFSSGKRSGEACATADVVVLDTMGELAAAYALGTVAIVGGSFVPRGGQNILEPAAQGVPVLHGPHMFLAPDQTSVLDGNGALQVRREQVADALGAWLSHPLEATRVGALGRERVSAVAGAAARHLEHLGPLLPR